MLVSQGHTVSGISLDPLAGSLYETAAVGQLVADDRRIDIRDRKATIGAIKQIAPDVVFHLAAQPLVRESYREPHETFETNAMGTLHLLEGVSQTPSVRANVVITTDKVYRNVNQVAGYVEADPLGGDDPYSASKAMADILTQSWVNSFPGTPTAIARGGNVIGGGDVSKDRLLVDLLTGFAGGTATVIRYPDAVRPWQHVLDCLNGYIVIADALLDGRGIGAWNIGPGRESFVSVGDVADLAAEMWGGAAGWVGDSSDNPHEANLLALDATRAQTDLGWRNHLPFPTSLQWTIDWQRAVAAGGRPRDVSIAQMREFAALSGQTLPVSS
jgi:CDP-glucose 4,6-dehydratase